MQESPNLTKKLLAALVIGNALEWYDFIIYSFLLVYISHAFFPQLDSTYGLLAASATFGAAFVMRPLGGLVLGYYADRSGPKAAITLVIGLMTIALLLLVVTPTYKEIGIFAPILIVVARLLQGFSAGGEFGPSAALLIKLSPQNQSGYYGSWQMVGQMFAMVLGSAVVLCLTNVLDTNQMYEWGWRIPFLLGLLIAPGGLYIRQKMYVDVSSKSSDRVYFKTLTKHTLQILLVMGLVIGGSVSVYINFNYMPTYITQQLHLSSNASFFALLSSVSIMLVLMPMIGSISDRVGKKHILVSSIALYLCSVYPLFYWLIHEPSFLHLMIVLSVFAVLLSGFYGVFIVTIVELFPANVRSMSLSLSYNLAVMLFGGFAQYIVTWLLKLTGNPQAISYYLIFAFSISLIAALCYQEKSPTHEYA